ncbi:MAG: sodium:proton antiporter, partial [Vicingaceae bacterium]|nr:sodium:proton antiporter [Vicingaceae bacterium]
MEIFIVLVFVVGYLAITLEHSLKIDKLVPALLMMALAWAGVAFGIDGFTGWFDSHLSQMLDGTNGTIDFASAGHEDRL